MSPKLIDMTGRDIDGQTVEGLAGMDRHGQARWLVRCVCGSVRTVAGGKLRSGEAGSCGCRKGPKLAAAHTRHGDAAGGRLTAEYRVWSNMIDRCERPGNKSFRDYGERGIAVCPRWRESFAAFLEDMGRKPLPRLTIDRIDNEGSYEPGNCRWATRTVQNRNKRNARLVHLIDKAAANDIGYSALYGRVAAGWSEADAVSTPVRRRGAA